MSKPDAHYTFSRRTYHMSIESEIIERTNRATSKKQISISATKQE